MKALKIIAFGLACLASLYIGYMIAAAIFWMALIK